MHFVGDRYVKSENLAENKVEMFSKLAENIVQMF